MWTKIRDIWRSLTPELKNVFLQLILAAFRDDVSGFEASPDDDKAREELRAECPDEVEAIEQAL